MNNTMQAITVYGPNDAKMETIKAPKPDGDMLKIKVLRTGICATDFSIFTGESSFIRSGEIVFPCRFGHEWAGVVEEVGENVTQFKVGDRVYSDNFVSCGHCPACGKGDYMSCNDIRSVGTVNCWEGCYAQYMYMPERHVFKLPDELSMDEGALIEPASIAYDAFKNTHLTEKDSVVVYGTGAIGLICIWLAKYYGAGKVIAVGRNENKLKVAQELGADILINNQKENAVKRIKDVCDGKGANMIIEATGAESALIDCINSIARYGRLSLLSFYEKPMNNIPIDPLVLGCVTVVGAAGCAGNAQAVCKIMCDNKAKLSPIITHHVKFEDCLDVFENEFKYHNEKIKIMIDFD